MAEHFDYNRYKVTFEVMPADDGEWHSNVYIRESDDGDIESFTVSPTDPTAGEARERAIRVAKSWIDQKPPRGA